MSLGSSTAVEGVQAQLGPFQRTALGLGTGVRTVTASSACVRADAVHDAVMAVLRSMIPLRSELAHVEGMRVPWQQVGTVAGQAVGAGRWTVAAGATQAEIAERDGGCSVTLSTPSVFADRMTLWRFFRALSEALTAASPSAGTRPFLVESGHLEMLRAGELRDEERHWQQRRASPAGDGMQLPEIAPREARGGAGRSSIVLDASVAAPADALARACGGGFDDVASLAMCVMIERLEIDPARIDRRVDARALMGLEAQPGVYEHAVPSALLVDLTSSARSALTATVEARRSEADFIGCPAPRPEGGLAEVLFAGDETPVLPAGWTLDADVQPVEGRVELAYRRLAAGGYELIVRAVDGDADLLARLWATAITNLTRAPEQALEHAAVLVGEAERADLANRLRAAAERPLAEDVCQVVARRAVADPQQTAIVSPHATWTFGDLIAAVSALARRMDGVKPADVVAVVVGSDRPEFVVGALGVLWRGAAFLPVDPSEPAARIEDALGRSGAVAALTVGPLPMGTARVPAIEIAMTPAEADAGSETPVSAAPSGPAYLLRTSGSTGVPKLVEISRANLANYLRWVADEVLRGLGDDCSLPVVSPAVFDASVKQTLGPLYAGRSVRMLAADRRDPAAVWRELAAEPGGVAINCVPSYWSALLDAAAGIVPRVEEVLLGGETITPALVERTREIFPAAVIRNLYGPTEATATATMGRLEAGAPIDAGQAVAGAVVVATDRHGAPLPAGVVGELAIGGAGVASGYASDEPPPSPFSVLRGIDLDARVYRTGDYGSVAADGRLRLLGRRDTQVKVNGWRIELAELESAAASLESVRTAVAAVDERSSIRLFFTGDGEPDGVRFALAEVLPGPMMPSSVHVVAKFPYLPSGKVDRKALLDGVGKADEVDPRTYTPEQLVVATAWRDLLASGWPRVTDEFFACGGHSLMLAQLVNRLRGLGYSHVSVRHVIRRPTVESIAVLLEPSSAS